MKNITTKSIIFFFILYFSAQLPTLAQKKLKKAKYTISDVWWTQALDKDGDGFTGLRKLHINVDVSKGSHAIYSKIYYKSISSNTYTLYYTSKSFSITKKNKSDAIEVIIGPPNNQLQYDIYDFKIEILKSNKKGVLATRNPFNDNDLKRKKFETINEDSKSIKILNAWWDNLKDKDNDLFYSYGRLNFIIYYGYNKNDIDKNFNIKFFYKPSSSNSYNLSSKIKKISVDIYDIQRALDTLWVDTKYLSLLLHHNTYDFKIQIYSPVSQKFISVLDPSVDSDLLNKKFETDAEDVPTNYIISDAWWTNTKDDDSDGYTTYRRLNFNVDAINGGEHDIYANIFYTSPASTPKLYYTTPSFTISGNKKSDAYWIGVGPPHTKLLQGKYDFTIQVYQNDGTKLARATMGPYDDKDLNDVKFEAPGEVIYDIIKTDSVKIVTKSDVKQVKYTIADAWWTDAKDRDSDGYIRYKRLHFNAYANSGTHKVFAKIYYKTSSSNSYNEYYTTLPFTVTENKNSDTFWVPVGKPHAQPPHNIYDFKIEIYELGTNKPIAIRTPSNDSGLANNKFEKFSEDPFPN